jgi:hypothetical protein
VKILSLGWGIQSFTLAAMAALREIEPIDYAINADTTHERSSTYEFAQKWTPWLEAHGVRTITVKAEKTGVINPRGGVTIPAFIEKGGMIKRQCTDDWKRAPMRRWIQGNRTGETVEQWLGISLDEFQRMKDSDVKYIVNRWPLVELRMTRNDCVVWLKRHDLEIPGKSACVFCPFQRTSEWRQVRENASDSTKALETDHEIREARLPGRLYVHPARIPLGEVDLRTPEEQGQLSLWDDECSGLCGV